MVADTAWDEVIVRATRAGFASLDRVELVSLFKLRASVMKSPPKFLRGPYRSAIIVAGVCSQGRVASHPILEALFALAQNVSPQTCSWGFDPQRQEERFQFVLAGPLGGSDQREPAV